MKATSRQNLLLRNATSPGRPSRVLPLVAAILAAVVLASPAAATHCADVECGDLDGSGSITVTDVFRLLRKAVALEEELVCPFVCQDVTTTTSTTTTTMSGPASCNVTFRLAENVDLRSAEFTVDYSGAAGEFVGEGAEVSCTPAISGGFFDDDAAKRLSVTVTQSSIGGSFSGPTDLLTCDLEGAVPTQEQFEIVFKDAIRSGEPLGTTGSGVCGAPITGLARPAIRDFLHIAEVSVGTAAPCPACECDLNDDGVIQITDAGRVLIAALENAVIEADCPPCGYGPEVRGGDDPVSIIVSDIICF